MKTSSQAWTLVQRWVLVGGLGVSTITGYAALAQDPGVPPEEPEKSQHTPSQRHSIDAAEEERVYHGQLMPLYDLLKKSSKSTPGSDVQAVVAVVTPEAQPLALLLDANQGREKSGADLAGATRQAYVLMFDPQDPRSQIAYQVAQAVAQTNELLDEELQTSRPESEAAAEVVANPPPIERVKVTGRLLQNAGLEAIAVTHIERAVNLERLAPLLEEKQKEAADPGAVGGAS